MNDKMPCPACGSTAGYSVLAKPKSYKEFIGSTCVGCGHKLTSGEVKKFFNSIVARSAKAVNDAIKRRNR